jgi:SHS2 domain-containing protein
MAASRFKQIEHPSDVGIIAFGKNHQELFENAAFGMFSLMADLSRVDTKEKIVVKVSADDPETLLVNWLNELIYLEDAKKIVFSKFTITRLTRTELAATIAGDYIDLDRHAFQRPVKAVTFSQLQLGANQAKIIFDV